jgi:hypothetical protein
LYEFMGLSIQTFNDSLVRNFLMVALNTTFFNAVIGYIIPMDVRLVTCIPTVLHGPSSANCSN